MNRQQRVTGVNFETSQNSSRATPVEAEWEDEV